MTTPTGITQTPETTIPVGPTADVNADKVLPPIPIESDAPDSDSNDERQDDNANSQAKRYRLALRAAEAERDALLGRVEGFQRAEVERLAAAQLAQSDDLFTVGGIELADLLDENGNVDAELVNAATATLVETRPGLHKNSRIVPITGVQNWGQGQSNPNRGGTTTWQRVLGG